MLGRAKQVPFKCRNYFRYRRYPVVGFLEVLERVVAQPGAALTLQDSQPSRKLVHRHLRRRVKLMK